MKISPRYTAEHWKALRPRLKDPFEQAAWNTAAVILRDRIENRFLKPVRILATHPENSSSGFGFATLALDCLLIDTLQAFRLGRTASDNARPTREFIDFLIQRPAFRVAFTSTTKAREFAESVRNGLLHDGETRNGWLAKRKSPNGKILQRVENGWILYRDDFHDALEEEFIAYLSALTDSAAEPALRKNFLLRMDSICGTLLEGTDTAG